MAEPPEENYLSSIDMKLPEEFETKSKEEQLALLDDEITRFSTFMANLPDSRARGALSNPEKALLKSYLVAKIRGRL